MLFDYVVERPFFFLLRMILQNFHREVIQELSAKIYVGSIIEID